MCGQLWSPETLWTIACQVPLLVGFSRKLKWGLGLGLPRRLSGKESSCQCRRHRRQGSIPGLGISPREGNGNPPQYSYLEKKNKEYWSRLPFPLPGNLPNTEIKLHLLGFQHWQADSLPLNHLRGLMYVFLCPIVLLTFHTYSLWDSVWLYLQKENKIFLATNWLWSCDDTRVNV